MDAERRKTTEAAMVALVAEFIGDITGLRPPLERSLFPAHFEPALKRFCDGIFALSEDSVRLDWLDQVNRRTNERNGTKYGWKFDINHNRAALTDHNFPALSVREAIDAAKAKMRR